MTAALPPPSDTPCWALGGPSQKAPDDGRLLAELLDPRECLDVLVVGAGLTGASTALHLAEARPDLRVALLDAGRVANGASGRGTGLLGPRLGPPVDVARRRFGDARARSLHERSERAVDHVLALAARCAPGAVTPCAGQLVAGFTPAEQAAVRRRARAYAELGIDVPLVPAQDRARPAPPAARALLHPVAAGVDPPALTRGLVAGATRRGVLLAEGVAARGLAPGPGSLTRVVTDRGAVLARAVVVTVDAADPGLALPTGGMLPLEVCAQATAVLPDALLAELGGADSPHVLSAHPLGAYRRITPQGRLVVGGGPVALRPGLAPAQLDRRRREAWRWQRAWLARVHPQLAEVPVEHAWSGRITVTEDGLPVVGRAAVPGEIWYAGGWNGHGLAATVAAGAWLAERVQADARHPSGRLEHVPAEPARAGAAPAGPTPDEDPLWRPGRPWLLSHRWARPAVRAYLRARAPGARACARA